jgi:uncharacterized damage-inducible protein DinB
MASTPFPEPRHDLADSAQLFVLYLDFFRDTVADKLTGLSDAQQRSAPLPSGWTLLEMVKHLAYMEQRWVVWGFLGEAVSEPWGDRDPDADRWAVHDDETADGLLALLREGGRRTSQVLGDHDLTELAADTGRFGGDADTPTLAWICFHVLQEYARHVGHVDVVRELLDGTTGE